MSLEKGQSAHLLAGILELFMLSLGYRMVLFLSAIAIRFFSLGSSDFSNRQFLVSSRAKLFVYNFDSLPSDRNERTSN